MVTIVKVKLWELLEVDEGLRRCCLGVCVKWIKKRKNRVKFGWGRIGWFGWGDGVSEVKHVSFIP